VESWFGAVPRWRAFHTQVVRDASIPKEQQTALLNSIEQRIAKIDTLLACIDTEELDRIKGFRIPTSAHVERLLVAKQVTSVSEVRLLPSGPDPERSTVFEVGIQPAPRSDGSEVPAIYLHLHTNEPITAKQCRLLPPKAFAASHLKSEEQRGYGKNWEDVQRQMGLDGAVYRGKTSDQLLKNLLRLTPSKLINALTTHGA